MEPGDIIAYLGMCAEEGTILQRGMNFRLRDAHSVVLMSLRPGAPYADRVEDEGRTLVHEGRDIAKRRGGPDPKTVDQPMRHPGGSLTQNGLFYKAAKSVHNSDIVRVYEKIKTGIWAYAGVLELVDAWLEESGDTIHA